MLSKNPLELLKNGNFSEDELAEALRLAIIAELDAINLYIQLANKVSDERFRKVFMDVAKEEKTHVGEFLALLKVIDKEQVSELEAGLREVSELTGISNIPKDPPANNKERSTVEVSSEAPEVFSKDEWEYLIKQFNNALNNSRKLRRYLPIYNAGRGVEGVIVETFRVSEDVSTLSTKLIPLHEISVTFRIRQRILDHARRRGELPDVSVALYAASRLGYMEDEALLKGAEGSFKGLLNVDGALHSSLSDWDTPGNAVVDIAKAIALFTNEGIPEPYLLILSPNRYSKLLKVHEKVGVMELQRVRELVKDIVILPHLRDDEVLLVSANPYLIDIAIGADGVIDYVGLDKDSHVFRAWETVALRVKNPKAILYLTHEK